MSSDPDGGPDYLTSKRWKRKGAPAASDWRPLGYEDRSVRPDRAIRHLTMAGDRNTGASCKPRREQDVLGRVCSFRGGAAGMTLPELPPRGISGEERLLPYYRFGTKDGLFLASNRS
jgi:hypothetical protein